MAALSFHVHALIFHVVFQNFYASFKNFVQYEYIKILATGLEPATIRLHFRDFTNSPVMNLI